MPDSLPLPALLSSYDNTLRARKRSDRTRRIAQDYVGRFIQWLDENGCDTAADSVSSRVVEAYLADLGDQVAVATLAIHYRTLRAFFGWCADEDEIPATPFAKLKEPKPDDVPVPVFSDDELRRLLASADGRSFEQRRDKAILYVLIDTGVRLGELLSIRLDSLNEDWETITVSGKTGTRNVPCGATCWQAIDRYLRARYAHPQAQRPELWLGGKGPLRHSGVHQMLKRRGRDAEVEGVNAHRFRHDFSHRWLLSGGTEGDLQRINGWASPAMVSRYGRSAGTERAREAHRKLSPADNL